MIKRFVFLFLFLGFLSVATGQQIETLNSYTYKYEGKTTMFLGRIVKSNPEARAQLAKSRVLVFSAVGVELVGTGFALSGLLDGLAHGGPERERERKKQRISRNLKIGLGMVLASIPIGFLGNKYKEKSVNTFNQNNLTQQPTKRLEWCLTQTINGFGLVLTF